MRSKAIGHGDPRAPLAPHLVAFARKTVERATLKFQDFRKDKEAIGSAIFKVIEDGELTKEESALIWLDTSNAITFPLAKRYVEMREFELIANFLRSRLHYNGSTQLTPRNRFIFDAMIAGEETALAVSLLRIYLKQLRRFTQNFWRVAGKTSISGIEDAVVLEQEVSRRDEALKNLPGQLDIAELELAEIETYLASQGSREDNRALQKFRDEIARVRKRFNLV